MSNFSGLSVSLCVCVCLFCGIFYITNLSLSLFLSHLVQKKILFAYKVLNRQKNFFINSIHFGFSLFLIIFSFHFTISIFSSQFDKKNNEWQIKINFYWLINWLIRIYSRKCEKGRRLFPPSLSLHFHFQCHQKKNISQ